MRTVALIAMIASTMQLASGQGGCMDTLAENFDSGASSEDGSCTYDCSNLATHYGLESIPTCIFPPFAVETCSPTLDCNSGYVPGTAASPSTSCSTSGCSLSPASDETLAVVEACVAIDSGSADDVATCNAVDITSEDATNDETACEATGGGSTCTYVPQVAYQPAAVEACVPQCMLDYTPGTVANPSTSCTTSNCEFTPGTFDVELLGAKDGHGARPTLVVPKGESWIIHGQEQADGNVSTFGAQIEVQSDASVVIRKVSISDQAVRQSELPEQATWNSNSEFRPCQETYRVREVPYSVCGAIYAVNCTLIVEDVVLSRNSHPAIHYSVGLSSPVGSAINARDSAVTVRGSTSDDNYALHGGAMYFWNDNRDGTVDIEDTIFRRNEAYDGGALHTGIAYFETLLTFRRATFEGNWAYANSGGALFLYNTLTAIRSSLFSDNSARLVTDGGAIRMTSGTKLEVEDTLFTNNHATRWGGAIYMESQTELVMKAATFTGNSAVRSGGAVHLHPNVILADELSVFTDNSATLNGGALHTDGSIANLTGTIFERNSAAMGGSVYTETASELNMEQCTVSLSTATISGGGIEISDSSATLADTQISECSAGAAGGAVAATARDTRPSLDVRGCTISDNTVSLKGGAIQAVNIDLKIETSTFTGNKATARQAWDVQGPCTKTGACIQSPGFPAEYGDLEECTMTPIFSGALSCPAFHTERGEDFLKVDDIKYSGTGDEISTYDPSQRPYCWDDGDNWNWSNLPCEQSFKKSDRAYDATPENTESCICQRGSSGDAPYYYDGPTTATECAHVMCHRHPPNENGEYLYQSCMFNGDANTRQWDPDLPRCAGPGCIEGVNLSPGYENVGTAALRDSDPNIQEFTGDPALLCVGAPQLGCPAVNVTPSSLLTWKSSGSVGAPGWEVCLTPDDPSISLGISEGGSVHAVAGRLTIHDAKFNSTTATTTCDAAQLGSALYAEAIERWKISHTQFSDFGAATVYTIGMPLSTCNENPCAYGQQCSYTAYSLRCSPCSENLISDGIRCSACRPGTGPSADLSSCETCPAGKVSSDGVCMECPSGLVPNNEQSACNECGLHQTAVATLSHQLQACGCESAFYNHSEVLHVCFANGYDEDYLASQTEDHANLLKIGDVCATCAVDLFGDTCITCAEGVEPQIEAGFTVPVLAGSRRQLSAVEVNTVFRCHEDMEIASQRCPRQAPGSDTQCAVGYTGFLCDSCATGYGMSDKVCKACEDAGYNSTSLIVLISLIVGITILTVVLSKFWKSFPLKHFARCAFQPVRILITYSQVTGQLGDVLDFEYPGMFGEVIETLRPVMDFWGILFRALGPSECFGLKGFTSKWMLRVVGLPSILSVVVFIVYIVQWQTIGRVKAKINAKGHAFFVVFFCYPTICIVSFAAFLCRAITPNDTVLESDGTVLCEDASHRTLQGFSVVVILLVAFGLPVAFGVVLLKAARSYEKDVASANQAVAQRLAEEMDVDVNVAGYVIRDITIGRDYSFLMDAFSPQYLYWEALDMLRKLALVGLVLLVGRGTVAQLSAAIILSFAFFALHMFTWPYKIVQDNVFRAATEVHVFIVITTALVLKNDQLLAFEIISSKVYDYVLFFSFILLVPVAWVTTIIFKLRYVQTLLRAHGQESDVLERRKLAFHLQSLGLASDNDRQDLKRCIDGWSVHKRFAVFVSHFKNESAAEARILKGELVRALRVRDDQVFLDSDNLTDLRELLASVKDSDAVILLLTKGVLSRPWCLLELHAALSNGIPVITVQVGNSFACDPVETFKVLDDLPGYLEKNNAEAQAVLASHGQTEQTIGVQITKGLTAQGDSVDPISFDPNQSSAVLRAQVKQMATTLVKVVCPENAPLLDTINSAKVEPWPKLTSEFAVYILHEPTSFATEQAEDIKMWLQHRSDLTANKIALSTDDRIEATQTGVVLLLQTKNVLSNPHCVSQLYKAAANGVPIVPAYLTSKLKEHSKYMYSFEETTGFLRDLVSNLSAEAMAEIQNTTGTKVETVGLSLCLLMPNIISKPLTCDSLSEREPQLAQIGETLRKNSGAIIATTRLEEGKPPEVQDPAEAEP